MGAFAYKVIESGEAFLLITDAEEAEKILGEESKMFYLSKGLEVQMPPDFDDEGSWVGCFSYDRG